MTQLPNNQVLKLTFENETKLKESPLLMITPEHRASVYGCWMMLSMVLPGDRGLFDLCVLITGSIAKGELLADEIPKLVKFLTQSSTRKYLTYQSDIAKAVATATDEYAHQRKVAEEMAKRRQSEDDYVPEAWRQNEGNEKTDDKQKPKRQHAEHPFPPSRASSDVPVHQQVVTRLADSFRSGEYIEPKRRIDMDDDELT